MQPRSPVRLAWPTKAKINPQLTDRLNPPEVVGATTVARQHLGPGSGSTGIAKILVLTFKRADKEVEVA